MWYLKDSIYVLHPLSVISELYELEKVVFRALSKKIGNKTKACGTHIWPVRRILEWILL